MNIKLDTIADALYIKIKKGKVHKTIVQGSFLVDVDKNGKPVGIEVLNYSKTVPQKSERLSVFLGDSPKRIPLPA